MPTLLKKWWVILIQGILMVILSFLVINNPIATLAGISLSVASIVLLIGILGVAWWFSAPKDEKETSTLIWSVVTALVGLLMAFKLGLTMFTVSILFGIILLANGYHLVKNGWENRAIGAQAWLVIIIGVLSVLCGIMSIFNVGVGAITISVLLGYQILLGGIALIALSFLKRRVVKKLGSAVDDLRARLPE